MLLNKLVDSFIECDSLCISFHSTMKRSDFRHNHCCESQSVVESGRVHCVLIMAITDVATLAVRLLTVRVLMYSSDGTRWHQRVHGSRGGE